MHREDGDRRRDAKKHGGEDDAPWRRRWSSLPPAVEAAGNAAPSDDALADAGRWARWLDVGTDDDARAALAAVAEHARRDGGARRVGRVEEAMERCAAWQRAGAVSDIVAMLDTAVRKSLAAPLGSGDARKREMQRRVAEKEKELMKNGPRMSDNREALTREYGIMWG